MKRGKDKTGKSIRLNIKIKPRISRLLSECAEELGISRSDFIDMVLMDFFGKSDFTFKYKPRNPKTPSEQNQEHQRQWTSLQRRFFTLKICNNLHKKNGQHAVLAILFTNPNTNIHLQSTTYNQPLKPPPKKQPNTNP